MDQNLYHTIQGFFILRTHVFLTKNHFRTFIQTQTLIHTYNIVNATNQLKYIFKVEKG